MPIERRMDVLKGGRRWPELFGPLPSLLELLLQLAH